jgi:ATPase family associated with various cellular activities (AAA)
MPLRRPPLTEQAVMSMNFVDAAIGAAVRRVASAGADPTDPFRGLYMTDDAATQTAETLDGGSLDHRLAQAIALLDLDSLDGALLGLCAAPVLDARYGRLIGYLHDDLTRKLPSPRLLAQLLAAQAAEEQILARLACDAPLRRDGAIEMLQESGGVPAVDRLLALDEQLAAFLLGAELGSESFLPEVKEVRPDAILVRDEQTLDEVSRAILAANGLPVLCADPDAEQILAQALGHRLLVIDAAQVGEQRLLARTRLRARLTGASLAIGGLHRLAAEEREILRASLHTIGDPPLLCCARAHAPLVLAGLPHLAVSLPPLEEAERARLWAAHLATAEHGDVVAAFGFSAQQIGQAAHLALTQARSAGRSCPAKTDLRAAAQRIARRDLDEHATLLQRKHSWEDLVLSEEELAQLRAVAARIRHRGLVLDTWGFGRHVSSRSGLKILFAGESGTGKTMACEVIANDLGLDLYRVDLSRTVSKFIGETEKNLARLFDAAEDSGAVIFFDEADALFGRRSAVSDAHDRYANLEVAYLLQRIEEFAGAVVLATNLRHNLDQAFLRRLDFAIDFPLPDRAQRRQLWQRHIPSEAPLAADVDLDALSEHNLPGGSIRNCALHAAFTAAENGRVISSAHLEHAVRLEQRKLGRLAIPRGAGNAVSRGDWRMSDAVSHGVGG